MHYMLTSNQEDKNVLGMTDESLSLLRHIRSATGRSERLATSQDWLIALAMLIREQLTEHSISTMDDAGSYAGRRVCYLSMEFLPGRIILYTLKKLGLDEVCRATMSRFGFDLDQVAELEVEPALGNGGLGRLAACLLDSMANLDVPAIGYAIRYDSGLFDQRIEDGWQVERPEHWLERGHPWQIPRRDLQYSVRFGGRVVDEPGGERRWIAEEEVVATAYDMPVPGYPAKRLNMLRLWSARVKDDLDLQSFNSGDHEGAFARRNAVAKLSEVLYPSESTPAGRELRFRQEYFFVSASVQDILRRFLRRNRPFEQFPDELVIHINDTHPSMGIAELMRLLIDEHGLGFDQAWNITYRSFAYTNHTLMPEALEKWSVHFFEKLLPRHLEIIYQVNDQFLREVAARRPGDAGILRRMSLVDEEGERHIRMAHLALVASRRVNGVSKIHTALLKQTIFADFDALYPDKIVNVTNGITFRRWLHDANRRLTALISSRIGDRWLTEHQAIAEIAPYADDPHFRAAFRVVRRENKCDLADLVARECGVGINVDSLFDVHVKRIHEYKRQILKALHVIALYARVRRDPSANPVPRTVIFAGKAAPGYGMAKLIIKLINDVAAVVNADPLVHDRLRLVFIPNYNVSHAQCIIPAADLSEQISTAGFEASGTGNMKLALNGALTIGTLDGANAEIREAVGAKNFFTFGVTVEEVAKLRTSGYDSRATADSDTELAAVLDLIASGYFSPDQPDRFQPIINSLVASGDHFLVLKDFRSYLDCQEQVEDLYRDTEEWTRRAILNVAGAGALSSDVAVRNYMRLSWNVVRSHDADSAAAIAAA
jgi:glycogen phosphorylase